MISTTAECSESLEYVGGAAFDVVHVRAFVHDDQRALESLPMSFVLIRKWPAAASSTDALPECRLTSCWITNGAVERRELVVRVDGITAEHFA